MKQSLQLKISQQLTMTPQLQQAIRLLQLSTLDLQQEIQSMIDANPMLEVADEADDGAGREDTASPEATLDNETGPSATTDSNQDGSTLESDGFDDHIPTDLPVDSQWDDIYPTAAVAGNSGDTEDFDFDGRNAAAETLQDHLLWQLNLTPMSDTDRIVALALIDAVLPSGFLGASVEEIFSELGEMLELEIDEVIAVLHRLQQFDPVGAMTANLRECLLVQLKHLPESTPWRTEACSLVDKLLPELGARNFPLLTRRLRLNEQQLRQVVGLIQSLDPRPGEKIAPTSTEYVTPDVFVHKQSGRWIVELNADVAPRIRINSNYAALIKRADDSADNSYLKNNLQEARWFLKSLQSRNETLMKVASCIVEHQQGFLEYGAEAMKPLVLSDVAAAIEMHESTVSRVTTNKYMHTPAGIFELKYFFSSHVGTDGGGECSSTAIRAIIKKTVAAESPKKPLSDSKIAEILVDQGINVARRTIAKYRESLGIPPSNERKRLV